jgi:hypothetical protein
MAAPFTVADVVNDVVAESSLFPQSFVATSVDKVLLLLLLSETG